MRLGPLGHGRGFSMSAAAALMAAVVPLGAVSPAAAVGAAKGWDFNGDGQRDLAIGVAGENQHAGSVVVLRGTRHGLSSHHVVRLSQDSDGVPGRAEAGDGFGAALASGDFDADGYADLAVGAPNEGTPGGPSAGSVTVFYGSADGLTTTGAHTLTGVTVDPEDANFGFAMTAADFDGDGDADLVAAHREGLGGVRVFLGTSSGLATDPATSIGAGDGLPRSYAGWPNDLAVGDLDNNEVPDLVGAGQEHDFARGAVVVIYAIAGKGLTLTGVKAPKPQFWTEDTPGVKGTAGELDAFGSAVGVGDVTGDGLKDLVIGAVQEPTDTPDVLGALHVLRGSENGVTAKGDRFIRYDEMVNDAIGMLGVELAVGDLNDDGVADVAVTHATTEALGNRWGGVMVLYGDKDGLGAHRKKLFTQSAPGLGGTHEPVVDYWGDSLQIRNVGKSSAADLIVTDSLQDVGGVETGMVNVLWGSSHTLDSTRSATRTQDSDGIPGTNEVDDRFGSAI